ncbi:MAG TPA: exodeoxyribonuclease VII small subunit [Candidatus Dormibacteraeota bacterium]
MTDELTYEQALQQLDARLRQLEDGRLSLEDALKAVDEARGYLKYCQDKLEAARKRIEVRAESPATTSEAQLNLE